MTNMNFRPEDLVKLIELCKRISDSESYLKPSTQRTKYAEIIFEKLVLYSISFFKLWPKKDDEKSELYLDSATFASIARNIIETHNILQYVCERNISQEEFNYRVKLMKYHNITDYFKIINRFGFSEQGYIIQMYDCVFRIPATEDLLEDSIYLSLSEGLQKEIIKGKIPYHWAKMVNKKSPLDRNIESGVYNILSNSIHSFPLGLSNSSTKSIGFGHFDWKSLLFITLEVVIMYLSSAIRIYLMTRPKLATRLSVEEKKFIKMMIRDNNFNIWLHDRIKKSGEDFFL
ncbi:hypothetical protein [Paenibacillus camerounensis]|uniref:hypothetical protein n=1 Tax=Paenibacillus camerounensis TaxID=1243663 RepID=UPI0005A78F88|nr:hypothetical protein [Paenibacillus camerounensis]